MLISSLTRRLDTPVYHDQCSGDALIWSQRQALSIIPVVDRFSGYFLGSVSVEELNLNEPSALITTQALSANTTLLVSQLVLDTWVVLTGNKCTHFPVADLQGLFVGVVHREDLHREFERALGFDQYGYSLIVVCNGKEPDLRSIIHIIETEGGRVLSVGVPVPLMDEENASVNLRLLGNQIDACIASLKRHGYVIYSQYTPESEFELGDRIDELLRFLEW